MKSIDSLRHALWNLDRRGYPSYKSIRGEYGGAHRSKSFTLVVDHVQGDPFAAPSRVRVLVDDALTPLQTHAKRACADFVHRALAKRLAKRNRGPGSGKSGLMRVPTPGQQILERTAVILSDRGDAEIRLQLGLPANGRRVMGTRASELLCDELPELVFETLNSVEGAALERHIATVEDAVALREQLARGLR
ncbi:MAG: ABC-ATPase domain-containing protein [Myxococcota bacterium]